MFTWLCVGAILALYLGAALGLAKVMGWGNSKNRTREPLVFYATTEEGAPTLPVKGDVLVIEYPRSALAWNGEQWMPIDGKDYL